MPAMSVSYLRCFGHFPRSRHRCVIKHFPVMDKTVTKCCAKRSWSSSFGPAPRDAPFPVKKNLPSTLGLFQFAFRKTRCWLWKSFTLCRTAAMPRWNSLGHRRSREILRGAARRFQAASLDVIKMPCRRGNGREDFFNGCARQREIFHKLFLRLRRAVVKTRAQLCGWTDNFWFVGY